MKKTKILLILFIIMVLANMFFPIVIDKVYANDTNENVPNYPDDIAIEGTYNGFGMEIRLNGVRVGAESTNIIGTEKGYATGEVKNIIEIQLAFGDGNIGSVSINGKNMTLPDGTKDRVTFEVEPASKYIIIVTKSQSSSITPRTIIWESDKANNTSLKDDELIKNGTIEILDIMDQEGKSVGLKDVKQNLNKNNGWASVIPGSKVILKLKPDYGYQLTSIKINDEMLVAGKEQSTFEYTMPDTNVHLSGIFEKVDDKVNAKSDKVKSGIIKIGESEIDSGSVILSVDDVTLSKDQIANFEKKANEYEISSYLNISLDKVLYKGTASDVWATELKNLNNEATITLQLEKGMDGDEVVLVHEKHDGTYEIIPTTYNSETNMITFKTSSFSNYAIASKTAVNIENTKTEENNPDKVHNNSNPITGDSIVKYIVLFAIALLGLITFAIFNHKANQKKGKH